MKRFSLILLVVALSVSSGYAQLISGCENVSAFNKNSSPDIGIIISSGDAETVWNALRLGVVAQSKGDTVVVFVIGKGIDVFMHDSSHFNISKTRMEFVENGGNIYTCATCVKMRNAENVEMCTVTSIFDLYEIVKRSKQLVTF